MNDRSTLSAGTVIPLSQSIFQRFALVWLCLIILLGFGIRLSGLKWGQAYSYFGQGDAVEAYQVAVNYGHGEEKALYLGQPNYNAKSKLPGPMWTLFCFASYRFWGSIEGVIFTIILLNTAVIYLNYLLARRTIASSITYSTTPVLKPTRFSNSPMFNVVDTVRLWSRGQ